MAAINSFLYQVDYDKSDESFYVYDRLEKKPVGRFPDIMECGSWFLHNSRLNDFEFRHMYQMLEEISGNVRYLNGYRL